ncbi:hypothetical protein [Thiomicrorhabdus sp. Kp2]|nr:hypothetical protein [Thiomicrorhabdus sp. Kp2]
MNSTIKKLTLLGEMRTKLRREEGMYSTENKLLRLGQAVCEVLSV